MIKNQLKNHATTLAVGMMLVAGAAPAMAESVSCSVNIEFGTQKCETGAIAPNAGTHVIHVSVVGANAHWELRDVIANIVVVTGQTSGHGQETTIFGLHSPSRYKGVLSSLVAAQITLSNT